MKIEELREIAKARTAGEWKYFPADDEAETKLSIQSEASYGPPPGLLITNEEDVDGILSGSVNLSKEDAQAIVATANHIDALLDVAASAKAACFSPALLSDKTAMIMRMGELHAAIAKLEAVDA